MKMMKLLGRLALVGGVIGTAACGTPSSGQDAGVTTVQPTFSSINQNIFAVSCAVSPCHNTQSSSIAGYLDLSSANAYASLVGTNGKGAPIPAQAVNMAAEAADAGNASTLDGELVASDAGMLLVDPGNPGNSFLLLKVTPGLPPQYGLQMPQVGALLTQSELNAIGEWIDAGAPMN
jgi:hypothetical protein